MLPESAEERSEKDDALTVAVMTLPVKMRECILLYYFEDMNTVEIAQTLGISQQAVSGRLLRARDRLRKALERRERTDGR
jgi:RNA polymerase sigma-70 factor (ECF subfamily)